MPAANPTISPIVVGQTDTSIAGLLKLPCAGAGVVRLGAVCDTPSQTLTCRVIFWDALGAYAASTAPVQFASDKVALDGGLYLAVPAPDAWFPVGGPSSFSVHVDAVSGGTWTITPMAQ